ncbi:Uracil-DNA glycosylase [Arabidopsis thaliana]|uniref:Uracil-DNA glycosylase, mitochondrial n=3 Tax=Arabidopsis TaxID=3701 RepID=UNG_ARATH|nr:uracil dna glycosylase [Arabidopsis thaliana]Q9LIH6.1 RecName: Full=Uracil-DNA glycosylase, mitochondrial; Short=AtUNG; Short=UDG; Flags: Precursor [Arabidopsis thaliana]KAG7625728.1 Uracil-DNA glycosylase-like [Arabidopsis thaliana x Arabidopsis arenosa]AAM61517.1 uracil-DNA glycosylase, putative [Arabidopsis thaliana]ABJ17110.1 At3g18630 [Arabidopsis thaliana]AEE76124.1 uracil dna glycosylase [Arabidopsis thaliana]OAP05180.1 UNG [Arabidopsis thaliana]|eukprot:NP_188493.1 uracil dna glycosylase [Arabidopsis thaliana]
MASSTPKTLMDFFQPAKRLKASPSSSSFPAVSVAGGSRDLGSVANSPPRVTVTTSVADDSSGLTPEQIARAEFNKFVAKSKRNLAVCSERVTKAKSEGNCYVPLSELLVEESWLKALPGEFHKPYAKSLSDFLEREIITDSKSPLIYPPQHLIFNALNTTPFDRVKTVIIGQDPYHGPGQAMGLSFSVPEGEKLPSSLLNIFKELHKDVGCSIPRHGNLQKWAVQGVLLLNAVLTVRSKQPNSHAKKGWEQFTDAVIQSISQQKEGVVFLLWGRYAQEKSKLIDATKHHILTAAHPSGLSANRGFFDCRHFSRANQLLEEMGIPPIDWQL